MTTQTLGSSSTDILPRQPQQRAQNRTSTTNSRRPVIGEAGAFRFGTQFGDPISEHFAPGIA